MKIKILNTNTLMIVFCSVMVACTKHKNDLVDTRPIAAINFSAPTAGAIFGKSEEISIQGRAIAANTIHGYDLVIKNANDATVYFSTQVHDHNDTIIINQKWKSTLT